MNRNKYNTNQKEMSGLRCKQLEDYRDSENEDIISIAGISK